MTFIFHITHIENLPSILRSGKIWCDTEINKTQLTTKGIAHENIKAKRARRSVPIAPGGFLADYVPFYFAPRSPMLCAIYNNRVRDYQGGQDSILHLVSKAEKVVERKLSFTFTNGHAEMEVSQFYDNLADLNSIDWNIMREKYWRDTVEDGDRTRRRQAEFLIYNNFPAYLITGIGVISEDVKTQVEQILKDNDRQITTAVRQNWYY
jgi:hypothetical protein